MSRHKEQKPAPVPYTFQAYPKMLYREGSPRPITVKDAEEEARMTAQGWGTTPIEPPARFVPQTDTEIALDRQFRAHKVEIDRLVDKHTEEMRVVKAELAELKEKHEKLLEANGEQTVDRARLATLESQNAAMLNELREANERGDGLVEQLGKVTSELEAMKKHAAAAKAVHAQKKE